jgi:hypothetical protein
LIVLNIPNVNTQIICGQKVLAIGTEGQRIDIILMSILVLHPISALKAFVYHFGAWHYEFALLQQLPTRLVFLLTLVFDLPKLYQPIVAGEKLWLTALVFIDPFLNVYFFCNLRRI